MRSATFTATSLGSKSFQSARKVALAPRQRLDFDCPAHHHFSVVFSVEAQLPTSWDCPICWASAVRSDGVPAEVQPTKPTRTHWDMLRERRSVAELEKVLAERLALLKAGAIGPEASERTALTQKRKAA